MGDQCSPEDIQNVKAILEELKKFIDNPQGKVDLQNKIKKCAKKIPLEGNYSAEKLQEILKQISDISQEDITAIVTAASALGSGLETPETPEAGSAQPSDEFKIGDRVKITSDGNDKDKKGTILQIINDQFIKIKLDENEQITNIKKENLEKIYDASGGKRKSKKSKSKKNKSKKSKSKKRRSKRRKHRKMRRTRK